MCSDCCATSARTQWCAHLPGVKTQYLQGPACARHGAPSSAATNQIANGHAAQPRCEASAGRGRQRRTSPVRVQAAARAPPGGPAGSCTFLSTRRFSRGPGPQILAKISIRSMYQGPAGPPAHAFARPAAAMHLSRASRRPCSADTSACPPTMLQPRTK